MVRLNAVPCGVPAGPRCAHPQGRRGHRCPWHLQGAALPRMNGECLHAWLRPRTCRTGHGPTSSAAARTQGREGKVIQVYRRKWVIHIERITREKVNGERLQRRRTCIHFGGWVDGRSFSSWSGWATSSLQPWELQEHRQQQLEDSDDPQTGAARNWSRRCPQHNGAGWSGAAMTGWLSAFAVMAIMQQAVHAWSWAGRGAMLQLTATAARCHHVFNAALAAARSSGASDSKTQWHGGSMDLIA